MNKIYLNEFYNFIENYNNSSNIKLKIDKSHGFDHGIQILNHTINALKYYNKKISRREKLLVKLAALLHDIDDSKYFPNNKNFENARYILNEVNKKQIINSAVLNESEINKIIKIISWVSCSKNGNTIPTECKNNEYLLYPRYADRLESLGLIGLERTLDYAIHVNNPICIKKEGNKDITIEEIYTKFATIERANNYSGVSASMIDHFYDKLLRLGKYPIRNKYFDEICKIRQKPLEDIILYFEQNCNISEEYIRNYIKYNLY
jgi:uncharacterized protein